MSSIKDASNGQSGGQQPTKLDYKRSHLDTDSDSSVDDQPISPASHTANKRLKKAEQSQPGKDKPASELAKKISFGLSQRKGDVGGSKIGFGGFKMGLQKPVNKAPSAGFGGGTKIEKAAAPKPKVAAAFEDEDDDDEEEEEMPPEAKMRMKNIGRNTPTSAGPNSFGKSRMGFCDSKKLFERQLKESEDKAASAKQ